MPDVKIYTCFFRIYFIKDRIFQTMLPFCVIFILKKVLLLIFVFLKTEPIGDSSLFHCKLLNNFSHQKNIKTNYHVIVFQWNYSRSSPEPVCGNTLTAITVRCALYTSRPPIENAGTMKNVVF